MPEWYKKRILQRPRQETQSITERPSETYQLELPEFRIPTVTNSEDSVMTGLENRKWRDIWEHSGRTSGINNTDTPLQEEHPSLFLLPFAPEVMGSGLGLGVLKTLGGYAGSYVGSKVGSEVGYALDNTFNKQLLEPLGEIVGGFAGFGKGYNLFEKTGMQGALKYLSKTGKEIPRWFMRPELRTNVGRTNQRTFFAEDQTPKYNSNQLPELNRRSYQSPSASQLEMIPQVAYTSNIQKQVYQKPQISLMPLKEVFGDSINIPDMVDFYRGSKPMFFGDMRQILRDPNFEYFQGRPFIDYDRPKGGIGRFYINENRLKQTIGAYKDLYTSRLNLPNTATTEDIYNYILSNPTKIDPALNEAENIQDILGLSLGYGIKDAMLFKDPYLLDLDGTYKDTVPGVFNMLNKRLASKQLIRAHGTSNGNHATWQFRHGLLDDWARKQAPKMPLPETKDIIQTSPKNFASGITLQENVPVNDDIAKIATAIAHPGTFSSMAQYGLDKSKDIFTSPWMRTRLQNMGYSDSEIKNYIQDRLKQMDTSKLSIADDLENVHELTAFKNGNISIGEADPVLIGENYNLLNTSPFNQAIIQATKRGDVVGTIQHEIAGHGTEFPGFEVDKEGNPIYKGAELTDVGIQATVDKKLDDEYYISPDEQRARYLPVAQQMYDTGFDPNSEPDFYNFLEFHKSDPETTQAGQLAKYYNWKSIWPAFSKARALIPFGLIGLSQIPQNNKN